MTWVILDLIYLGNLNQYINHQFDIITLLGIQFYWLALATYQSDGAFERC